MRRKSDRQQQSHSVAHGGEDERWDHERCHSFSCCFSTPPVLDWLMFSVQCMRVCACAGHARVRSRHTVPMGLWSCIHNLCFYHMHIWLHGYACMCTYCIACKLYICVHIPVPVYTGPYVETYLFAHCNQVRCPPRGLFVLCYMDPMRVQLTRFSSNFNINHIRVQHQCLGSDTGLRGQDIVCVYV